MGIYSFARKKVQGCVGVIVAIPYEGTSLH
jgi:hypothetical protein